MEISLDGGVVYWYSETLSTPKMFLDSRHCRYMSFLYCGHIRYLIRPATNESVGPVVSCYVWAPYEKKKLTVSNPFHGY